MENFLRSHVQFLGDLRLWVLLFMYAGWVLRIQRALRTLVLAPHISPIISESLKNPPKISVIIPAKNEENNIEECLASILTQNYPNYEVLVANDNSTDKTPALLSQYADRIKIVNVPKTPEGWTGKNFAIHTAIDSASGEWLLFTDADTRHDPASLLSAFTHAERKCLDFLTLLPRCITRSFSEAVIQPTAMALTGLWFPIEKINRPKSRVHFANGQFILLKKSTYLEIGGHKTVREAFLEDFALIEEVRKAEGKVECAFGTKVYGTRMYDSFDGMWHGWRRIYLHGFKQKPLTLISKALETLFFSVMPSMLFLALSLARGQNPSYYDLPWKMTIPLVMITILTAWQAYGMIKAKRIYAVFHPIAAIFVTMVLFDAFWMAVSKKKTFWR